MEPETASGVPAEDSYLLIAEQDDETRISIYRYNPDVDNSSRMRDYTTEGEERARHDAGYVNPAKIPALLSPFLPRRRVCGSDGLNMNGKNMVWPVLPISALTQPGKKIVIRPLPGFAGDPRFGGRHGAILRTI